MLSIFMFVTIATTFSRKAYDKDLNRYLWGTIGILSYFAMQIIAGVIIALTIPDLLNEQGALIAIDLCSGLIGVGIAYFILNRIPDPNDPARVGNDDDLLDSNL